LVYDLAEKALQLAEEAEKMISDDEVQA